MSEQPEYDVLRSRENGQMLSFIRISDRRRFGKNDPEYKDFLDWNARQERPLNLAEYQFPEGHVACSELAPIIETCRQRGITLFVKILPNGTVSMEPAYAANFPEKGDLYQLCEAAQRKDGLDDGIQPRPCPIWVTQEMLTNTLPAEVRNADSDLRKVSSWPIVRTFVFLDVSDFSKAPPGQEVLIINSLVRMLNDPGHWIGQGHGLLAEIEARMCIGDGYIFVLKQPMLATYFAAYLAYLIELLVANRSLPVEFHFRIGVHCGPVYTFWDPGRNGWNYIGEGINGGNRVLSAMGKEYDDTLYISGEVRQELMATADDFPGKRHLLRHLHNRGRRPDKHTRHWRVYEVNHSAVCAQDLPTRLH
jgi:class 3 adenylate cyclase